MCSKGVGVRLFEACGGGDVDIVEALLEKSPSAKNYQDKHYGWSVSMEPVL